MKMKVLNENKIRAAMLKIFSRVHILLSVSEKKYRLRGLGVGVHILSKCQ